MTDIWFISDTHFFHENILKFTDSQGNLIRPGFTDVNHMNETIVENWNKYVKPGDKIYHLGDVTTKYDDKFKQLWARLPGGKRLIVGNHDDVKKLVNCFHKIQLWRIFKEEGFVCTHLPLDREHYRKVKLNVHGHIHQNDEKDQWHKNICVERTNYRPLHIDELKAMASKLEG